MSKVKYRPEIDGLRAVSVIGVLFYHAHFGFPGGFVGVDVFFVISGFLITSIIAKGLDNGSFSFAEFWVRRIKRILPAISALVAIVLFAGLLILDPESLKNLAESAFAQCTMRANFYFLNASDGYFHTDTEQMPLLHTWSLAVEEQFYLFLPMLLFLLFKYIRKHAFAVLTGIATISFILSIFITRTDQSESFYLLHTRTWELLSGSLLALGAHRIKLTQTAAELLSSAGLSLIFAPMFMLDASSSFPGLNALSPVAGAVMFIAGTQNQQTIAGRLTSLRPVAFIGLISYSLYLWHWPLFSFSRHLFVDAEPWRLRLCLLLASFVLAILSWKFIELPFRRAEHLRTTSAAVGFGILTTVLLCCISAVITHFDGFPYRLADYAEQLQDMDHIGRKYRNKGEGAILGVADKSNTDFILWGDSHAMMLAAEMDRCASKHGLKGIAYIKPGRIPVTNLRRPNYKGDVINYNRKVFDQILSSGVKSLILVSRWSINLNDTSGERLVTDQTARTLDPTFDNASESLKRQLTAMLQECSENGIKVYLVKQIPETSDPQTARHFYMHRRYPRFNAGTLNRFTVTPQQHRQQQAAFEQIAGTLSTNDYLMILDPSPPFFHNPLNRLEASSEQRSYYRDNNHLTEYGVRKFMYPLIEKICADIKGR